MPKYMFHASYATEGLQGLKKDKASGRKAAVAAALKAAGGKLEAMYFTFGADDVVLIADLPGNVAAAAVTATTRATGAVQIRTTPLLTIDEMDEALGQESKYRAPGAAR